jgi:hypothetical protein
MLRAARFIVPVILLFRLRGTAQTDSTSVQPVKSFDIKAAIDAYLAKMPAYTTLNNTVERTMEYEADMYGLYEARQPDGEANGGMMLGRISQARSGASRGVHFFWTIPAVARASLPQCAGRPSIRNRH